MPDPGSLSCVFLNVRKHVSSQCIVHIFCISPVCSLQQSTSLHCKYIMLDRSLAQALAMNFWHHFLSRIGWFKLMPRAAFCNTLPQMRFKQNVKYKIRNTGSHDLNGCHPTHPTKSKIQKQMIWKCSELSTAKHNYPNWYVPTFKFRGCFALVIPLAGKGYKICIHASNGFPPHGRIADRLTHQQQAQNVPILRAGQVYNSVSVLKLFNPSKMFQF